MQPLYLHVGLAKTGTTYLQRLLADNRPRLREAGFVYPFVRPEGQFHAAVEVRGVHERWGLTAERVAGSWDAHAAVAREAGGTAIVSHEILAGATEAQIDAAVGRLDGFEVHVVVTARDLARQVPAHWQESVKNGQTHSFAAFTREVLGEPGAHDSEWRTEQDLPAILARWGRVVAPERLHVVVVPPAGSPPDLLWQRFATATGLPAGVVDPATAGPANPSLGAPAVHLLRALNEHLDPPWSTYLPVVKRLLAQRLLAPIEGPRARTPEELRPFLGELTDTWITDIGARGHRVHGDLAELAPTEFGAEHPDALDRPWTADELAPVLAALVERAAVVPPGPRAPATDPSPAPSRRLFGRRS